MFKAIVVRPQGVPVSQALLLLTFEVALGVLLAFAWSQLWPSKPFFGSLLSPLSGTAAVALAPVLGFAVLAGVLRVLMPCGMPVLFTTLPLLQSSASKRRVLVLTGSFTVGTVGVLAVFGAVVGAVGGGVYWLLGDGPTRDIFTRVVYSSVGVFALVYGLAQAGLLRLPPVPNPFRRIGPTTVATSSPVLRSLSLGAFVGGGMGAACPLATSIAVVAWVGATGSPALGALVEVAFGVGIAAPVLLLGLLTSSSALPQVGAAMWSKRQLLNTLGAGAMIVLGVSTVLFWSVLQ